MAKCPRCGAYTTVFVKYNGKFRGCPKCYKKPTNADRIRSMTDEELADFIYDKNEEGSREAWLAWLKEEVDNGSSD